MEFTLRINIIFGKRMQNVRGVPQYPISLIISISLFLSQSSMPQDWASSIALSEK